MMMLQDQLSFRRKPLGQGPNVDHFDVEKMMHALRGCGWQHAHALTPKISMDARMLRACAEASKGKIISGQNGYHLTEEASPDDIIHCRNRLRRQANQMNRRADEIQFAWQQAGGSYEVA